jgi:hypothetical protein
MKLDAPKNSNYAGTVVKIKALLLIENADRLVHANIFGNLVIVGKDTPVGSRGIFFPLETALSSEFLHHNSLYRDKTLNKDVNSAGFFEENGRIRAVKLRGAKSMGLFIPLSSLLWTGGDFEFLELGDTFDTFNGKEICHKYLVKITNTPSSGGKGKQVKRPKVSMLVDRQFAFHYDTPQLGKNIHRIKSDDIFSITYKMHGTSLVSSKVLCNRKLSPVEAILKFLKVKIHDTEYRNIYSSRTVVKNDDMNTAGDGFYGVDIWGLANATLKDVLTDGMSIYAEVVGYLPEGSMIQQGYDYGQQPGTFGVYVYRITYTNQSGIVYEFSAKQVQEWCKANGIKAVPELYYGKVLGETPADLMDILTAKYLEKPCTMCKNKVPAEGIVVKIDNALDVPAFKLKSFAFFEHVTKQLDKGIVSVEDSTEGANE